MAGTVVLSNYVQVGDLKWAAVTCTADASAHTYPSTDLNALLIAAGHSPVYGSLLSMQTNPGSTAPTDNYDITLVDQDGFDRLYGVGLNRDTSVTERVSIPASNVSLPHETLTITIANNSVNSAVVVITFYWNQSVAAIISRPDYTAIGLPPGAIEGNWYYTSTSSLGAGSAAVVIDPTAGYRIAITDITISTGGTTAAIAYLFFAADADLTFTAGTDQVLEAVNFIPSATAAPGVAKCYPKPVRCETPDMQLHYQNTAALTIYLTLHGYEY